MNEANDTLPTASGSVFWKFRIWSYESILDDPKSEFWILRIILELLDRFQHIGNLDESNESNSNEGALGLGLGFEMFIVVWYLVFVSAVIFRLRFSRCFSKTGSPHVSLFFFNFVFHNRGTIHVLLVLIDLHLRP